MALTLTPEVEELVNAKIASGAFPSADEVIRTGLRLIEYETENYEAKMATLRKELAIGTAQLENGESTVYSSGQEIMDSVEARGRALLAQRKAART